MFEEVTMPERLLGVGDYLPQVTDAMLAGYGTPLTTMPGMSARDSQRYAIAQALMAQAQQQAQGSFNPYVGAQLYPDAPSSDPQAGDATFGSSTTGQGSFSGSAYGGMGAVNAGNYGFGAP